MKQHSAENTSRNNGRGEANDGGKNAHDRNGEVSVHAQSRDLARAAAYAPMPAALGGQLVRAALFTAFVYGADGLGTVCYKFNNIHVELLSVKRRRSRYIFSALLAVIPVENNCSCGMMSILEGE